MDGPQKRYALHANENVYGPSVDYTADYFITYN